MPSARVVVTSPHGQIVLDDTRDHLELGVLRLLGLDPDTLAAWLAAAEAAPQGELLARLRTGWQTLRPAPAPHGDPHGPVALGPYGEQGALRWAALAERPAFGVALGAAGLGWLVAWNGREWARVTEPPAYDTAYFEGDATSGGYTAYEAEAPWRLEKAARQVRELAEHTGLARGRVLDVGAGYGFFCQALRAAGYEPAAVEASAHARERARALFGLEPLPSLEALPKGLRFAAITLWDVLEHVADPRALLTACRQRLAPGGWLALKTPNLECPEAELFGAHYHSLKREHLVYFTPASLAVTARAVGLEPVQVTSTSHLLRGFLGDVQVAALARAGRGADLVAYLRG